MFPKWYHWCVYNFFQRKLTYFDIEYKWLHLWRRFTKEFDRPDSWTASDSYQSIFISALQMQKSDIYLKPNGRRSFRPPNYIVSISLPYWLPYRHGILLSTSKRYQNGIVMSDLPIWISEICLTQDGRRGVNRCIASYRYRYDIGHYISIEWFMSFWQLNSMLSIYRSDMAHCYMKYIKMG